MTVSSTTNKTSYTGNGSTDTFAYGFPIYANADLKVYDGGALKSLTTHYTVTNAGNASGGNVVFTAGNIPASGNKVVIERILARTQGSDYQDYSKFPADTLETNLDRLTYITQEIDEEAARSIKFATTVTDVGTVEVTEDAATRANKVFGFDASGGLIATHEIGVVRGNWAASTAYTVRDIIKDTSNSNIYVCLTTHTSSGAQPISSNTDSAKWFLLVDAASAATSATNAATSATNAAASATTATTQASTATTQASAASTSATNAASSATGAASSATAAAASYDSFDDRYLGVKSSNPTTDNDSNALVDGALYFNTTNNAMMVYDLGNTTWLRTTPSSTDQGHINTVSGIQANVTTVAGISANVTTVAGISSDVTATAGKATEIGRLGTADAVSDMNTLGTADAVSDMNTLGTSGNVTNMNTLAGIAAAISTCATNEASINRYSSEYTISTSTPGSPSSGDLWYDSNSGVNQLKYYNGSSWIGIAPGITSETDPSAIAMAIAL